MVIYLLLFFIMFRTVFFAVLTALIVYKLIDHFDLPTLSEKTISIIFSIIAWWLKIFFVWALAWRLYSWISNNRWTIINWFEAVWVLLFVALIFWTIIFAIASLTSYLKFRLRKKAWLLKDTDKFSLFDDDTKRVKSLSKKDKETDDKLSTKVSWCWLRALISIPLLIIIVAIIILLMVFIESYL